MIAATIVARNYTAQAEVLAASFLRHHPGARFVTLVIDGDEDDTGRTTTAQTVVLPGDLGLPAGEWEQMAGIYSVMEFATALKPAFLRALLSGTLDCGEAADPVPSVVYLDPDIVVYRPFPEVFTDARLSGIGLTPHVLHPLPRDGLDPDESVFMHAGLFNLGFICVGQHALPFLDWWHERLRIDAVVDIPNALFTDQRWVDWVPTLFGADVLRDHGLNVAYWNLHERPLTRGSDGVIMADRHPLKFFHFSGYDPDRPWELSKHAAARPRCVLYEHPIVAELCHSYADALADAGFAERRQIAYRLAAAPNGLRLGPLVRAAYRFRIKEALGAGAPVPPAPFAADGGAAFSEWLMAPLIGPVELALSAWHVALWRSRPDLQAAFTDPGGRDATRFRSWLDDDPSARLLYDDLCLPSRRYRSAGPVVSNGSGRHAETVERVGYGWNVVGYHSAESGTGEAGRRMHLAITNAGISTQPVSVSASASRQHHQHHRHDQQRHGVGPGLVYRDSLYCVNADEIEQAVATTEGAIGNGRSPGGTTVRSADRGRRVGLWFWEVDRFPDRWNGAYDLLDEIWCASPFTAEVIGAVAPIPVHVVPLPVWMPGAPTPFSRRQLGLPDGFVFLFSFDYHSVFERKNPLGLLQAYRRAFVPSDGASLVLKSINGADHPAERHRLRDAVADRADIVLLDGYVDSSQVQGMIEHCDCFVSLHRSEGFALHLATAMAAGRPVIATGYSGNMAFMDPDSAFLVPYELEPVGPGNGPYPASARWAAPDLDAAARLMRAVFDDPPAAAQVAERGRIAVLDRQGLDRASRAVLSRLAPDLVSALAMSGPA